MSTKNEATEFDVARHVPGMCGVNPLTDTMREAPKRRAERLSAGPRRAPVVLCDNAECNGQCRRCAPWCSGAGLSGAETAEETAARQLRRAIQRAHSYEARHNAAPAIVKRSANGTTTVLVSAADAKDAVRRSRIARQATRDAAEFRRAREL